MFFNSEGKQYFCTNLTDTSFHPSEPQEKFNSDTLQNLPSSAQIKPILWYTMARIPEMAHSPNTIVNQINQLDPDPFY